MIYELIEDFEAYNRVKALSEYTLDWYNRKLQDFAAWLEGDDPLRLSSRTVRQYISHKIGQGLAPRTVRGYFAAINALYGFLVTDEVIEESANPMRKLSPPRVPQQQIEPLTESQARALLSVFNKKRLTGHRNYAMCLLILDTGLRVSEVAKLTLQDVNFDDRRLKIIGKGNKKRWVYIGERVVETLQDYLDHCRPQLANIGDALFLSSFSGRKLNPTNISKIIQRRMDEAEIPRANSSAHRLRHTFAVNFLRGGGGVFPLQRLLGHSSLAMTRRYVMLAEDDLAQAHRKASPVDRMAL